MVLVISTKVKGSTLWDLFFPTESNDGSTCFRLRVSCSGLRLYGGKEVSDPTLPVFPSGDTEKCRGEAGTVGPVSSQKR